MASTTKSLFSGLFFILIVPFSLIAQSNTDQIIVGTVGGEKVTYQELIQNYTTGETGSPDYDDLKNFLPIYLDYKAKLQQAREEGYYEDSTLINEHRQYAKQAAYAYWLQNEIKPAALKQFKSRADRELKTFHILIALPQNATPQQEADIVAKLNMARNQIMDGADLKELNEEYSTVANGRSMGGELPWISAGRTVKPFEDQAYALEVGEVSRPFKTQFGYHIILLQDERERIPSRLTQHIYVRATNDTTGQQKIEKAYSELEQGQSWEEVVRTYSEDGASARNSGNIGWVNYQENYNPDFLEAVMTLDTEKPYSEPINTSYGYHIIRIDSVERYASEEARDEALMDQLSESPYYEENNTFVINYLRENLSSEVNDELLSEYENWITSFDTVRITDLPPLQIDDSKTIYTIDGHAQSLADFHQYVLKNHDSKQASVYRELWFEQFTQYIIDDLIIDLTLNQYPEFEQQSKNYRDGLVVYNINENKIWSSATVDSSRLRSIYESNIGEYSYPERPFYYLISARADSTIELAMEFVNEGGHLDSLRSNIQRLGVSKDSTSSFKESPFDRLANMEVHSFSDIFEYNNNKAVFWLEERLPARPMTFEEAFNRLVSDFQPQREQEWTQELRQKYNISPDFENLRKAYQQDS